MAKHVKVTLKADDYETELFDGRHTVIGDEPVDLGGADKGPAPYELLLMSLGSCSVITMKMYAKRKELQIDHIEMELTHSKEDRTSETGATIKKDVIQKKVTITGNLTDAQRERMLQISAMCPVHRTIESAVEIRTEFA